MSVGLVDPDGRLNPDLLEPGDGAIDLHRLEEASSWEVPDSDRTCIVTVGEAALLEVFRSEYETPVVPVGVDAGVPTVPASALPTALDSIRGGEATVVEVPTIHVRSNDHTYRALMDVMAVTAEPARISEFRTKRADGTVVDRVRADGVVVSGPAGTPGYGTAVEGPILDPAVEGFSVVPVGQFRTEHPRWVLAPPIEIEIVRETEPIALVVDDREVGTVRVDESIHLSAGPPLVVATVPASKSPLRVSRE